MDLISLFKKVVESELISRISFPNIPFPTLGGHFCWDDLASINGWRLQKNKFTGHCRILNPQNIRVAWGGENALREILEMAK